MIASVIISGIRASVAVASAAWHTPSVGSADVERLQAAAEAYNRRDVEPLVSLLDDDVDWRASTRGRLWWKRTPRCHGREDARANFELRLKKASLRPGYAGVKLDEIRESGDRIMVGATWETEEGNPAESAEQFFQVMTIRDGKIIDIQGCKSRRDAQRKLGD
jgi:ketosteroid isomerase-like protein